MATWTGNSAVSGSNNLITGASYQAPIVRRVPKLPKYEVKRTNGKDGFNFFAQQVDNVYGLQSPVYEHKSEAEKWIERQLELDLEEARS